MVRKSVATRKMGSFDMASAADRSLQFREDYPNSKIATTREKDDDGLLIFKTYIWKDKRDYMTAALVPGVAMEVVLSTADSEGTAKQAEGKESKKDFEKLETISVGRALAFLGYLKDGQVASTEEMENYHEYKEEQARKALEEAKEYIEGAVSLEDLKERWISLAPVARADESVAKVKDDMKLKLEAAEEKKQKKASK